MRATASVLIVMVIVYLSCGVNYIEGACSAPDPAPEKPLKYKGGTTPDFTATSEYMMEFECETGYRIEGAVSFTCAADATAFTPAFSQLPTCLDTCLTPGDVPKNGKYKGTAPTFPAAKDSTIDYECNEGYTGGGTITCSGGMWDPATIPTCTVESNATPESETEKNSAEIACINLMVLTAMVLSITIFVNM